jgi:hypothetical protein
VASGRLAFGVVVVLLAVSGFGGGTDQLRPGDRWGGMRVIRGTATTADLKLFDVCDPVILASGRYTRRCGSVPRVSRLFVGYGQFELPGLINKTWKGSSWAAWLDGRRLVLPRFGTSDRTLVAFPPAGGRSVTLREWRVMLVKASPGGHSLRYRFLDASGVIDATWVFAVSRR